MPLSVPPFEFCPGIALVLYPQAVNPLDLDPEGREILAAFFAFGEHIHGVMHALMFGEPLPPGIQHFCIVFAECAAIQSGLQAAFVVIHDKADSRISLQLCEFSRAAVGKEHEFAIGRCYRAQNDGARIGATAGIAAGEDRDAPRAIADYQVLPYVGRCLFKIIRGHHFSSFLSRSWCGVYNACLLHDASFSMQLRIFTTGGTIDKVYFDAKSEYEVGEPVVGRILHDAGAGFEFKVTELLKKDSLDLDDADRAAICAAVEADPAEHVLITHGTDTMPETGRALMGIAGKTIVLTGSLSPARFQSSDAIFNVGCAIGAVQSLPHGVYVVMNGQVFAADKVRKNRDANRFESL